MSRCQSQRKHTIGTPAEERRDTSRAALAFAAHSRHSYARHVYEASRDDDERPGCRETLLITRAVFAVLLPPLAAIMGLLALIGVSVVLLSIHPALLLIPVVAVAAGLFAVARWERGRHHDLP